MVFSNRRPIYVFGLAALIGGVCALVTGVGAGIFTALAVAALMAMLTTGMRAGRGPYDMLWIWTWVGCAAIGLTCAIVAPREAWPPGVPCTEDICP